jgi:AraC family transcriptional regulator
MSPSTVATDAGFSRNFVCEVERARQVPGLIAVVHEVRGPATIPLHYHDWPMVTYLVRGVAIEVDAEGNETRLVAPGLNYCPAGVLHAHRVESKKILVLCSRFDPDTFGLDPERTPALLTPKCIQEGPAIQAAMRITREYANADAADLVLQGIALELLGHVLRSEPQTETGVPPWLTKARDVLLTKARARVSDVAADVAVHPSHLSREFRRHYQTTPGEFLRRARLERARREIVEGGKTLAEIAAATGFADQAHMSREFRKAFGVSPSDYRRPPRPIAGP